MLQKQKSLFTAEGSLVEVVPCWSSSSGRHGAHCPQPQEAVLNSESWSTAEGEVIGTPFPLLLLRVLLHSRS